MNTYDDFKQDNFTTALTSTMIIDLQTDDGKLIYIVFNPLDSDGEHKLAAEVYTTRKKFVLFDYQFSLPCNYGDELAIRELVVGNYLNDNLFWANDEDEDCELEP